MKTAEIWLHWKQGDEMSGHISEYKGDIIKGLQSYSDQLKCASETLEKISQIISKDVDNCSIEADTHMITIIGPDEIIDELISQDLVQLLEYDDEDDDDCCDEEDVEDEEI